MSFDLEEFKATIEGKPELELRELIDHKFNQHKQAREARRADGNPGRTDTQLDDLMRARMAEVQALEEELFTR